jgi:hypothetical protein
MKQHTLTRFEKYGKTTRRLRSMYDTSIGEPHIWNRLLLT